MINNTVVVSMSKIQSESKSQLFRCCQLGGVVVVSMSKIQSESKSQQGHRYYSAAICCGIYVKDTIWKQITTSNRIAISVSWLWYLCQRYNLKANHNCGGVSVWNGCVVVSMSKIQSESKSQPWLKSWIQGEGCGIYVKDTIWKQITTSMQMGVEVIKLWYLCQRYNLKANHNFWRWEQEGW